MAAHVLRVDVATREQPETLSARTKAARSAWALVRGEDEELVRVRQILVALRPDLADPFRPAPPVHDAPSVPRVQRGVDPESAMLADVTRARATAAAALVLDGQAEALARVLARLDALPPDACAVLRWLRARADLRMGLRGLYCDLGLAFASADQHMAWRDLGARREGAPAHGRALVLDAARAWWADAATAA